MQGWGEGTGHKGNWLQARDLGGWEFTTMNRGPPFPVRDSSLSLSIMHPLIFFLVLCMLDIKRVSLWKLKINHASGSKSGIYSCYTGPHSSKPMFLYRCLNTQHVDIKGIIAWDFLPLIFPQKNPFGPLIYILVSFWIKIQFHWDIRKESPHHVFRDKRKNHKIPISRRIRIYIRI